MDDKAKVSLSIFLFEILGNRIKNFALINSVMKNTIFILFLLFIAYGSSPAQQINGNSSQIVKIEAQPAKGFAYPYYLYVPRAMRESKDAKKAHTILVIPNNSGKTTDDFTVQEADVQRRIKNNAEIADRLGVALLMPVFPRPGTDWKIYTHALDRDAMITDKKEFARFDLQLIRMIDDARAKFSKEKLKLDKRVMMLGFSASGMFVNRFTFLHPKRVKAAAVGSPGGWAIAPAASFNEKMLRYPIGTGDLKSVSGEKLDLKNLRKVPLFMFLGDSDDNDSVVFRDSYEKEDEDLIFALFGKTPVERWDDSKKLYQDNELNAEFRLYPNVKHAVTKEMFDDIFAFLLKHK
jgi:dienelactone hydrolase